MWLLVSYLTFWTTFAPLVCFCKSFGKIFSKSFANSQRYRHMIAISIFKIWNSSPCFKCFSFEYIKAPPQWNFPFSFQEGFEIDTNLKFYFHIWIENLIPFENILFEILSFLMWSFEDTNWEILFTFQLKIHFDQKLIKIYTDWKVPIKTLFWNFLKWWCSPFALGLIFSPPLALSAKNGKLESPFSFFSPFCWC